MSRTKRRATVAVLTAVLTVMTVGLAGPPASAAVGQPTARLDIRPDGPRYYNVRVSGVVRMTQAEAQDLLNRGHLVVLQTSGRWRYCITIAGEKICFVFLVPTVDPTGLRFDAVLRVPGRALNVNPEGRDKLSMVVRLINSRGQTVRSGRTNRVVRRF